MTNNNDFFVDFGDETAEELDNNADHLPEGYLRVKLIDVNMDVKDNPAMAFKFQVNYGPLKGRFHTERVGIARFIENEDYRKTANKKMGIFASRTGAVPKDAKGQVSPDWSKGVGQEYILDMVRKPAKNGKVYTNMDFAGLWPINHATVQTWTNDVRAKLGLPAIAGNEPKPGAANGAAGVASAAAGQPAGTVPATAAKQTTEQMASDIFS